MRQTLLFSNVFAHSFQFAFSEGMRSPLHHVLTKCAARCAFLHVNFKYLHTMKKICIITDTDFIGLGCYKQSVPRSGIEPLILP